MHAISDALDSVVANPEMDSWVLLCQDPTWDQSDQIPSDPTSEAETREAPMVSLDCGCF